MSAYEVRIVDWSSDVCSSDLCCRSSSSGVRAGDGSRAPLPRAAGLPLEQGALPQSQAPAKSAGPPPLIEVIPQIESLGRCGVRNSVVSFVAPVLQRLARDPLEHDALRSEEHTTELQSLMRTPYAVFCLTRTITKTSSNPQ